MINNKAIEEASLCLLTAMDGIHPCGDPLKTLKMFHWRTRLMGKLWCHWSPSPIHLGLSVPPSHFTLSFQNFPTLPLASKTDARDYGSFLRPAFYSKSWIKTTEIIICLMWRNIIGKLVKRLNFFRMSQGKRLNFQGCNMWRKRKLWPK